VFRILTAVDHYDRECPLPEPNFSLSKEKVAACRERVGEERGLPKIITGDKGLEFYSKAMNTRVYRHGVQLEFIRPGRPVENSHIKSFSGRLRDERLNVQVLFSLADVKKKLEHWR
jgi:putative transposase